MHHHTDECIKSLKLQPHVCVCIVYATYVYVCIQKVIIILSNSHIARVCCWIPHHFRCSALALCAIKTRENPLKLLRIMYRGVGNVFQQYGGSLYAVELVHKTQHKPHARNSFNCLQRTYLRARIKNKLAHFPAYAVVVLVFICDDVLFRLLMFCRIGPERIAHMCVACGWNVFSDFRSIEMQRRRLRNNAH